MSLPWFRMYVEFSGDPIAQSLAFEDQRHYIIILCLKGNGTLDRKLSNREAIIARGLGLDPISAAEVKRRLMEVGFVDKNWQPVAWEKRQYSSDVSSNRVRKYRKVKDTGNVSETVTGNVSETALTISVSESVSIAFIYKETAEFIFNLILTLNPKHRAPNLDTWANDIRLMCERDGRTTDEIRALFEWANKHHFWKTNILSPATLRKQWDKLVIQRQNTGEKNGTHQQIDNSAIGQVRAANERARQRENAHRQSDAANLGTHDDDVRPPLEVELRHRR